MPKYFFHFPDSPDDEAIEDVLDGPDKALAEATTICGQLIRDQAVDFWYSPDCQLYVTDEQGAMVCTVRLIGTRGDTQENRKGRSRLSAASGKAKTAGELQAVQRKIQEDPALTPDLHPGKARVPG